MLSSLHIENIAVIKNADIDFKSGFNALTGETGAGKSILLGSVGLIMGERPSKDMIRSGESKAVVSAVFSDLKESTEALLSEYGISKEDDGCLYISRTVQADGKAQTKINGMTAPVSAQKAIAASLINIHGQHDSITLLSPNAHIEYLDRYSSKELEPKLAEYRKLFSDIQDCQKEIGLLTKDEMEKERLCEMLKYQISDIDSAKLKVGDEEALEAKRKKVSDSERIQKQSRIVMRALLRNEKALPAKELIERAISAISAIREYIPKADEYIEKLTDFSYELEDIAESVDQSADIDFEDPTAELDRIEEKLDKIKKLEKKYGKDIEAVLSFRADAAKRLSDIELSDERLKELENESKRLTEKAMSLAEEISEIRKKYGKELEKAVLNELAFLDMPKVRFSVGISRKEKLSPSGIDDVEFLISANPGEPLKPINKIASGGELSRIMLALKTANVSKDSGETLIFDEIDSGVSGATSQKIGFKLRTLGKENQVICVTHSAQVAATANTQYLIKKEEKDGRVQTSVNELSYDERIMETARIMGGMQMTESLIKTAKELLDEFNG